MRVTLKAIAEFLGLVALMLAIFFGPDLLRLVVEH
jgi:hypothetical protein